MKKVFVLLLATALLLSLAACGGSGKNSSSNSGVNNTAAEAPQIEEKPEAAPAEETPEPPDDEALAEAERAKLVGEWNMNGVDQIGLTFNADGTGTYHFLDEKIVTFTYLVSVSHRAYNNGAPYDDYMLKMTYGTGEVEDIIFFFNEETGNLCFHNSEHGGYGGVLDYAEWTRKA